MALILGLTDEKSGSDLGTRVVWYELDVTVSVLRGGQLEGGVKQSQHRPGQLHSQSELVNVISQPITALQCYLSANHSSSMFSISQS